MGRRERYWVEGPHRFGDAELVALVLGTGTASRSAFAIAAALVDRFDGLRGLARREPQELTSVSGVGEERAVRLHAALEAGRRAQLRCAVPSAPVCTPHQAWRILEPGLRCLVEEELHGLFLDRRRRPLALRTLTHGSDAFTVVDPRQVFRVAMGVGASAVILAHNHPSGDPEPSTQDEEITERVARAGHVVGVPLVDHLVIGADGYRSLAETGNLPAWEPVTPLWTSSEPHGIPGAPCGQHSSKS